MKDFTKYLLATVLSIMITGVLIILMFTASLVGIAASGDTKPVLTDGSVLHLDLNGTIAERAEDNPMDKLMGNDAAQEIGLGQLLTAIKVAKDNDNVKGIYLESGALSGDFASYEELRQALLDFKESKKFVLAYADTYTQGGYYLASTADTVLLNPSGMLDWHGVASQPIFFKDLLEKIGVKMQVFRVGTYKSAVEPYTNTAMSDANRAQTQAFISDIWDNICQGVSASRNISIDSLNAYADRYMSFTDAQEYCTLGLVDALVYADGVRNKLRSMAGVEKVELVSAADMAKLDEPAEHDDKVAVYYAYGSIVDEAATTSFNSEAQIVGQKVVEDLDELANDDDVKAVVLRINSGGGSAYASEQMWRAIQLLKEKKPVVVSMGGMAASGGYYMACGADCIYADATTLTGSIGIFGMFPDATNLLTEKLGLHFDIVKTNEAGDFGAMGRSFNEKESAVLQTYINRGYALFTKRVAEGRGMTVEAVDSIAQGRVWTGAQALDIKLVDKIGTLEDAIAEAAARAELKEYAITNAPAPAPWIEKLLDDVKSDYMEREVRAVLGEYYAPLRFVKDAKGMDCIQARIPFDPNLK